MADVTEYNIKTGKTTERSYTQKELDDFARMKKEHTPTVQQERQVEYPDIGDQLDAIMKWLATENEFSVPAELKSIAMKCMSVKAKYPKPEENK